MSSTPAASNLRRLGGLVLLAGLLTVAACGGESSDASPVTDSPSTATVGESTVVDQSTVVDGSNPDDAGVAAETTPPAPVAVPEALQFTGSLVGGEPFDAATLAGRPVLMWFWAPG